MSQFLWLTIVRQFASALDRCDFDEAARLIAADCRYELGSDVMVGPRDIIASYRASAEWAARTLDDVAYGSEVHETGDGFAAIFTDRIVHHGRAHEYRSRQRIWLNAAGEVVKIAHEELDGERKKLEQYFESVDVKRR